MFRRAVDLLAVTAVAAILIAVIAAPVLRASSDRVFGMPIVGVHHDPFTMMEQFVQPISASLYRQPVTDVAGALLARAAGPVAAYNWLVLISFPLSAAAAYLLARHLSLGRAGAAVAALAFAFSPFHLAHAAYHPQVAQTQWLPLYLLALWRCLDKATGLAVACLAAATAAVTLSNFYGGLIAGVITPVAVAAYWLARRRTQPRAWRSLIVTVGTLAVIAAVGVALYAARAGAVSRAAVAFPRADVLRYSARWTSYIMPPVEHPLLGAIAHHIQTVWDVRQGMLEQQVSLGWGLIALALVAVLWRSRSSGSTANSAAMGQVATPASRARVPILVAVGATAFLCSLSPEWRMGVFTIARPSALLYAIVPMFRSYARFGVVVQLMTALLAGIGIDCLRRSGTLRARLAWVGCVALVVCEYAVSPAAMSRDVLPTAAHRWVVGVNRVKVLDCVPVDTQTESVQWLSGSRVILLAGLFTDCTEPHLAEKLAANGFTHLLVRRDTDDQWFPELPIPDGFALAASFDDGRVFEVTARAPSVYTAAMTGFSPREHDPSWAWRRWMGRDAAWTVIKTGAGGAVATLTLEMLSFDHARRMEVQLNGRTIQTVAVESSRRSYQIGPLNLARGINSIAFHPVDTPTVADDVIHNGDRRPLSFALGAWQWTAREIRP